MNSFRCIFPNISLCHRPKRERHCLFICVLPDTGHSQNLSKMWMLSLPWIFVNDFRRVELCLWHFGLTEWISNEKRTLNWKKSCKIRNLGTNVTGAFNISAVSARKAWCSRWKQIAQMGKISHVSYYKWIISMNKLSLHTWLSASCLSSTGSSLTHTRQYFLRHLEALAPLV